MASGSSDIVRLAEIFSSLLELEKKAAENYNRLSLNVDYKNFRNKLAKIAADEEEHAALLEEALRILQKV